MLADEVRIAQVVSHPNLVQSYEFIETKDDYILVMEYVAGGDLFDLIHKRPRESMVRRFIRQTLNGLAYMHKMGICHRDIKVFLFLFLFLFPCLLVSSLLFFSLRPSLPRFLPLSLFLSVSLRPSLSHTHTQTCLHTRRAIARAST